EAAPPHQAARRRVLFVEASRGGVVGGSLTGILELLPHLDRFEPVLVLAEPKPGLYVPGVRVHVLSPRAAAGPVTDDHLAMRTLKRAGQVLSVVLPRARELVAVLRAERPAPVYLASGLNSDLP